MTQGTTDATAMAPPPAAPRRAPRKRVGFALFAVVALAAWTMATWTAADPAATDAKANPAATIAHATTPREAVPAAAAATRAPARLHPGMDEAAVRAVLGGPIGRGDDDRLWVYGPSWLRFECGRLVEWYSSPLAPLKVPVAAMDDEAEADGRALAPRRCAQALPAVAGTAR